MKVTLVGMGMGRPDGMTVEARRALVEADAVIGAARLLDGLPGDIAAERLAMLRPDEIASVLEHHADWQNVCVVLSGDVGFYSGARKLLDILSSRVVSVLPGISSPQYLAARLRRPWQDFRLVSAHGLECDFLAEVLNHPAVMFLTGGTAEPADIARELCRAGLGSARMTVGENLSCPDERIVSATAHELQSERFDSLAVALVENDETFRRASRGAGIPDAEFVRGEAPMTKCEVRAVAVGLLRLREDAVAFDIGAGTGSVAVEMALQARRGRVYAVESREEAVALLEQNRLRFGVHNMNVIAGAAPEALGGLPVPDAAFIGGSRGGLAGIARALAAMNPAVRLVISAITLETLSLATSLVKELSLANPEIRQVAVTRMRERGGCHMPEALNPVYLVSGGGRGE